MFDGDSIRSTYAYAHLGGHDLGLFRVAGPGLGNMLFPWARSVISARRYGLTLIEPTWPQVKLGPVLRRERDSRTYSDLFDSPADHVRGWRKLVLLAMASRVTEATLEREPVTIPSGTVVMFRGMSAAGLFGEHDVIRRALWAMTRHCHRDVVPSRRGPCVGLHVRLGDFVRPGESGEGHAGVNERLPLSWYIEKLRQVRMVTGDLPAEVFSDGRDEELAPLLLESGCRRADYGSSISDLFALSRCDVLVASMSSFSMWASYLGQVPTVWPAFRLERRPSLASSHGTASGLGGSIGKGFADALRQAIDSRSGGVEP